MSARLTSVIKWGCIVYSIIFLPRLFFWDSGEQATAEPTPLRVGVLSDGNEQKSVLAELAKEGYTVDKLLVVDRADEFEPHSDTAQQSMQLDQLLAHNTLDEIDVLLCHAEN